MVRNISKFFNIESNFFEKIKTFLKSQSNGFRIILLILKNFDLIFLTYLFIFRENNDIVLFLKCDVRNKIKFLFKKNDNYPDQ